MFHNKAELKAYLKGTRALDSACYCHLFISQVRAKGSLVKQGIAYHERVRALYYVAYVNFYQLIFYLTSSRL